MLHGRGRLAAGLLVLLGLSAAPAAWSCADIDCSPPLALQLKAEQCSLTGLPFLSPDNDTRINLGLLAEARGLGHLNLTSPQVPFEISMLQPEANDPKASAEALASLAASLGVADAPINAALARDAGWLNGRCAQNRPAAAMPFLQALAQSGLTAAQQQSLASARVAMLGLCETTSTPAMPTLDALPDDAAAPWATYLHAIRALYLGQFAEAQQHLQTLGDSRQPWLAETADYLLIRVGLQQAQATAFDEYGFYDPHKVDPAPARQAGLALQHYLQRWPQGQYLASAQGLQRRIDWLSGDSAALASRYAALLDGPQDMTLWNELDLRQLAPDQVTAHPVLLLVQDLRRMRAPGSEPRWPLPTAAEFSAQQAQLQRGPAGSLTYLQQAYAYYVAHDYAALAALPAPTAGEPGDLLAFSGQMLRGMALMALQRWPEAATHWQVLRANQTDAARQQLIELAQALTLERGDRLADLLATEGPVRREALLLPVLRYVAPAQLLRQVASDPQRAALQRNTALFTLLLKQLQRGQYADFLRDQALLTEVKSAEPYDLAVFQTPAVRTGDYVCPTLTETLQTLVSAPTARARNCLAEQFYRAGWDDNPLGDKPPTDQLAGSADRFGGTPHGRLALYRQVIADTAAPRADRSYALYRAINCFASSGYNHCGSEEIPKAERQRWFRQLKDNYANTPWAAQLRYWW